MVYRKKLAPSRDEKFLTSWRFIHPVWSCNAAILDEAAMMDEESLDGRWEVSEWKFHGWMNVNEWKVDGPKVVPKSWCGYMRWKTKLRGSSRARKNKKIVDEWIRPCKIRELYKLNGSHNKTDGHCTESASLRESWSSPVVAVTLVSRLFLLLLARE